MWAALLRLTPPWVPAAVIAALSLAIGVVLTQRDAARIDAALQRAVLAHERQTFAEERQRAAEAARVAADRYRELEARWHAAQQASQEEHDAQIARARAAADRAATDVQRLQHALSIAAAALRGPPPGDPLTPWERQAAATGLELLGRCADRYRRLALDADTARAAGQQCERAYDALTDR